MTQTEFRLTDLKIDPLGLSPGIRKPMLAAALVLATVFGAGGYWAATAPLGGSVVSSGKVVAQGRNVVVQNLEGGILSQVHVVEGQRVTRGELLAELDTTASQSQLDRSLVERAVTLIELQRWRAERDGATEFVPDLAPLDGLEDNPRVTDALRNQTDEFNSSRDAFAQALNVIDGRISNEQEDLIYLSAQLAETEAQTELVNKELENMQTLQKKGLVPNARVISLERELSRLQAQRSNVLATTEKSNNNIASFSEEKDQILSERRVKVSENLTRLQRQINQTDDVITRLKDVIRRSDITAPVTGTVFSIPVRSIGAVIGSGKTIVEILPGEVSLEIEAMIEPRDVTKLHIGQEVDVVFPTDQTNVLPPLKGEVSYVSADAHFDEVAKVSVYLARVSLPDDWSGRTILPGNVAEVFFKTKSRTLLELIADPITRFTSKTFVE